MEVTCIRGVTTRKRTSHQASEKMKGRELRGKKKRGCFFLKARFDKEVGGTGVEMRKERASSPGRGVGVNVMLSGWQLAGYTLKMRNKGQGSGETAGAQQSACKHGYLSSIPRLHILKRRMWQHTLVSQALADPGGCQVVSPTLAYLVSSSPSSEELHWRLSSVLHTHPPPTHPHPHMHTYSYTYKKKIKEQGTISEDK